MTTSIAEYVIDANGRAARRLAPSRTRSIDDLSGWQSRQQRRDVDLEPIDRLEEKVKLLVGMVDAAAGGAGRAAGRERAARAANSKRCARGWPTPRCRQPKLTRCAKSATYPLARREMLEQLEALNL